MMLFCNKQTKLLAIENKDLLKEVERLNNLLKRKDEEILNLNNQTKITMYKISEALGYAHAEYGDIPFKIIVNPARMHELYELSQDFYGVDCYNLFGCPVAACGGVHTFAVVPLNNLDYSMKQEWWKDALEKPIKNKKKLVKTLW